MFDSKFNIVGLREKNSVDFIKKAFELFNQGMPIAFVKDDDPSQNPFTVSEILTPEAHGGWFDFKQPTIDSNTPAQIVFSSGTEGAAKAILLNHNTLENTVVRLNKVMKVDASIKEYIGVPVFYSFGFGRCRAIAAVGGKGFIPENGFNPLEIKKMLENDLINAISAVPTLWRLLLEKKHIFGTLCNKIKWIEIGSQFMSLDEKKQMLALFPEATIVQHYGLTEASRATFLVLNNTVPQQLDSVGKIDDEIEIKISENNQIMIRGDNVANGVFKDGHFKSLKNNEGWLITNDLGHIKNGYLYYDGRSDDIINCGGIKVNPELIQFRLEKALKISQQIVISKFPCPLRGEGFLVAVLDNCSIAKQAVLKQFSTVLLSFSIHADSSIAFMRLEQFPATKTGKVQRKKITQLYLAEASHVQNKKLESQSLNHSKSERYTKPENYLFDEYALIFPQKNVSKNSTFASLGGDSLNYVQISMAIESYLGYLPANWEKLSIGDLTRLNSQKRSFWSEIESSIILRVIAIIAVVLTHADFNYAGGGTLLLFVLIGYNIGRFKYEEFINHGAWNWLSTYSVKILIPYTLLILLLAVYQKEFVLTHLLLVTNLIELKLSNLFPFWFVQVLIQSLLLITLLFSFNKIKDKLKKTPWETSLTILTLFIVINLLIPYVWDTEHLRNLVPHRFVLLIWLGYCFNFANTQMRKILIIGIGVLIAFIDVKLNFKLHWVIVGSLVLTLFPVIKIPYMSKSIANLIASSTFYIFIFNGVILAVLTKMNILSSNLLMALVTIVASIIIFKFSELLKLEQRVINMLLKFRQWALGAGY